MFPQELHSGKNFRRTFPKDTVDESTDHLMIYNGSGRARVKRMLSRTEQQRSIKGEVYRKGHSTCFCAAAWEPESTREMASRRRRERRRMQGVLMHIVKPVGIDTIHIYIFFGDIYLFVKKGFGTVGEDPEAVGCDRTGATKDFIHDGQSVSSSAIQRVMHRKVLER